MKHLAFVILGLALCGPAEATSRPGPPPSVAQLVKNGRIVATGRLDFDRADPDKATITIHEVLRDRDPRYSLKPGQVLPAPLHPMSTFDVIPGASCLWVFKSSLSDRTWISLQHRDKVLQLFDSPPKPPKRPKHSRR